MPGVAERIENAMSFEPGGIDCDIHPAVPAMDALLPYLGGHWREAVVQRGVHELNSIAYPQHAPLSARPDWRSGSGRPGSELESVRNQALAPFGTSTSRWTRLFAGSHMKVLPRYCAGKRSAV